MLPWFATSGDFCQGYEAALSGAALFDRSFGEIELIGTEVSIFLHNLCTNDIKGLPPGSGCEAFFCTATAKVVLHGWVWRYPPEGKRERLILDLPAGLNAKAMTHLDRYLISEDVTLADRTGERGCLHFAGPRAAELLGREWKDRSLTADADALEVRCLARLGVPGFDLLGPVALLEQLAERMVLAGARRASGEAETALRIEAGTPLYGLDIDETTFAAELGRGGAISYNKGCYLGQEPIVMARDRGAPPRAFVGLMLGEKTVAAGSALFREEKEVGKIVGNAVSPRLGRAIGLAYVRRNCQGAGTVLLVGAEKERAEVVKLPFGR